MNLELRNKNENVPSRNTSWSLTAKLCTCTFIYDGLLNWYVGPGETTLPSSTDAPTTAPTTTPPTTPPTTPETTTPTIPSTTMEVTTMGPTPTEPFLCTSDGSFALPGQCTGDYIICFAGVPYPLVKKMTPTKPLTRNSSFFFLLNLITSRAQSPTFSTRSRSSASPLKALLALVSQKERSLSGEKQQLTEICIGKQIRHHHCCSHHCCSHNCCSHNCCSHNYCSADTANRSFYHAVHDGRSFRL